MDPAPSSASLCPGCGKPVDPLRAGQVAIVDGGFRYFCNAECKKAWAGGSMRRPTLDAMTADPPPVASYTRAQESGVRAPVPSFPEPTPPPAPASRDAAGPSFVPEPTPDDAAQDASAPSFVPEATSDAPSEPAAADEDASPSTLRSPEPRESDVPPAPADAPGGAADEAAAPSSATAPSPAAASTKLPAVPRALAARIVAAAPAIGIAAGVLAAVVGLGGEGAASARLPLALFATAVVVARVLLRPRDPSEPSPWFVAAAIVPAAIAAALARAAGDDHAEGHAVFVGLAAAGALVAQILVDRARRDVVEARARASSALAVEARVVRPGGDAFASVEAAQVKPGEQVVVEAGETIAVDGIVAAGTGEVAPWVDSPVVVAKREGDAVVAGASVLSGRIRVNTTFSGPERAWLRLGSAPASRIDVAAPLVALARRTIERGVPIAALLVAGATYATNGSLGDIVVAACAGAYAVAAGCAVAAVGLAHARGHVAAQRRGIVYRDAEAFDRAARADVAVVCSRGTILLGEPEIVAVEAIGRSTEKNEVERVLALAAGAEIGSTHPFGAAVLRAARARSVRPENVRSALKHSGLGVTALAPNGDKVIVGSRAFLLHEKVSVAIADARVSELEAQGRSVLLVALAGRLVGLLALQDGLRPGARAAVQRLHDARIEPVLLSGEARDTCETIARALDIEHVRPEILPSDRGAEVRALAEGGHVVAALGHASSDDGALGAADVSVAMCAAGSAPGEWAVALASDDVRDAALALTVPRACRERAKTAAVVGAAAQLVSGLAIAFGLAPPAIAPVVALVAGAAALQIVREPTTT